MVFKKLTDADKEQLAIFGQEHDKKQVSMMRALIMRGASPTEAKALAVEREKARNELVEALEKERDQRGEEQEEEIKTQPKATAKRASKKTKVIAIEDEKVVEPLSPSPKIKRTRSKVVKGPAEQLEKEAENQITILA
jgi:hypothetical protein